MAKVKVEEFRQYELYTKEKVAKLQVSGKYKQEVRKMILDAFQDGRAIQRDGAVVVDVEA